MIRVSDLVETCSPQYSGNYLNALDRVVAAFDLELDQRPQGPDFEGYAEIVDQISAYQQELEESTAWAEELLLRRFVAYGGVAASHGTLTDTDASRLIETVIGKARGDALEDARDLVRRTLPILPANELAAAGQAIGALEQKLASARENPDPAAIVAGREAARLWKADRSVVRTETAEPSRPYSAGLLAENVVGLTRASIEPPTGVAPTTGQLRPPPAPIPLPAAGWYVDPDHDGMLRRWNGTDWTSETTIRSATARRVSFGLSIVLAFKGIFTYRGRSTAGEFWWFFLFSGLVSGAAYVLALLTALSDPYQTGMGSIGASDLFSLVLTAWFVVYLLLILPLIVRRLHDKDMSGWLAVLIPIPIASLVLLILLIGAGTPGPNRYGPVPTEMTR